MFDVGAAQASLNIAGVLVPAGRVPEGLLIRSISAVWLDVVAKLGRDWRIAYTIPSDIWEELVAGAFHKAGFDDVILTPRSRDHGRDVIATKKGVCSIKIVDSVKAYGPGKLVRYDDVRSLMGVL